MKFSDFVERQAVTAALKADTKEGVIREMVQSLLDAGKLEPSEHDGIVKAILKREELGSTGIGRGVAVPHTKHASVKKLVGAVAVSHMAAGHVVKGVLIKGWPAVTHLLVQYARLVGSLYLGMLLLFALVFVPMLWVCGVRVIDYLRAVREPAMTAFSKIDWSLTTPLRTALSPLTTTSTLSVPSLWESSSFFSSSAFGATSSSSPKPSFLPTFLTKSNIPMWHSP